VPASGILPAYAPLSSLDVGKDRAIHSIVLTPHDYWFLEGLDVYAADFHKMDVIEQLVGEDRVVLDQTAAEIQRRVARFTVPLDPVGDEPKPGLDC
jgi:hypothetical protein